MKIDLALGEQRFSAEVRVPAAQITIAQAKYAPAIQSWEDVVDLGLHTPIGAPPLRSFDLRGKKVAVITDDWGRPTPAHRVLPAVLRDLHIAGAAAEDITILTGTGVHVPMNHDELVRKLGADVVAKYRCLPHDAFDDENMTYIGLTPRGTPLWINSLVARADFKVAVGRIAPHNTHGYEGGAKMITPATSYWLTVLRNHSCNFSPHCEYGSYGENPSRADVDDVGAMVDLSYIVNFVVNRFGEPLRAFCGHRLWAHRAGIAYGDREVWGAETGIKGDVTIATLGANLARGAHAPSPLEQAAIGTRAGYEDRSRAPGDLIFIGHPAGPEAVPSDWEAEKFSWSFDQIFKEHERRDQFLSPPDAPPRPRTAREISDRCKSIRGEYYARRPGYLCNVTFAINRPSELVLARNHARFVANLQEAVDEALSRQGPEAHVLVLPEAANTLPMPRFHTFPEVDALLADTDVAGEAAIAAAAGG